VALVGGVGGAKLALGLARSLPPEKLTIIVNTGDDLWYYGLRVCPDVDTVLYTLSGRVDPMNGWGLANETTTTLDALRNLGEAPWFRLGDQDIATHMLRTELLRRGVRLTEVIARLAQGMGIPQRILPMSDQPLATIINTAEQGELEFQEYFVRYRWQPMVTGLRYAGSETAMITPEVRAALEQADVLLIAPSNPWLSVAPILAVPHLRDLLLARQIPRIAITPIVGGKALKGPAAKIMAELGYEVTPASVAAFYGELINGFVYDVRDAPLNLHSVRNAAFDTIMVTELDKMNLAQQVLQWARQLEV
jgi:LPPG:FO 2-phospho-L-lactate transferase